MHNVITVPIWLMGDHAEVILRALLAPLSDPRGLSDSTGYPGCRLMLMGLLGVLAAVWAWGRRGGPPPEGPAKKLRGHPCEPRFPHAYTAPPESSKPQGEP